jgi:hypothetical protein
VVFSIFLFSMIERTFSFSLSVATSDSHLEVYSYWTDLEARCLGSYTNARALWEELLTAHKDKQLDTRVWTDYIHQEINYGEAAKARTLFKRFASF